MTAIASDWKTVSAAVAGPNKGERGCQDAVALRLVRAGGRQALILALADGAGSASHGGDAAQLIVQTFASLATGRLRHRMQRGDRPVLWDLDDMAALFQRARERVTDAARMHHHALREWGSTGLLAVVTDEATVLAQMGDGAICLRNAGQWTCPIWPDLDGYVNVTTFVTHGHAPLRTHVGGPTEAILLFSDGLQALALDYPAGRPHVPFCHGVVAELAKSADPRKLQRDLTAWLASDAIRARSDDDISLAMAIRDPTARLHE